jgi:plasmid stabilization system protein ParE
MIEWTDEAIEEINGITEYLYAIDAELGLSVQDKILTKINWLSTHAMAGGPVKGLGRDFKTGYAIKTRYKILYQVLGKNHILVIAVRSSAKQALNTQEIRRRTDE